MYTPIIIVLAIGILIAIVGFIIGRIEKRRLEQKQEHMEYLEQKQKEYFERERNELPKLERQKREYERLLAELDRSTLPTKKQLEKLHWYMNQFGYVNTHQQNQLNQFYSKNYPKNPFE